MLVNFRKYRNALILEGKKEEEMLEKFKEKVLKILPKADDGFIEERFQKLASLDAHPNKAYTNTILNWYLADLEENMWQEEKYVTVKDAIYNYYNMLVVKNIKLPNDVETQEILDLARDNELIGLDEYYMIDAKVKKVDFQLLKSITSKKVFKTFDSFNELFSLFTTVMGMKMSKEDINKYKGEIEKGHKILYEDNKVIVYKITNQYASWHFAKVTPWCISMRGSGWFNMYAENGKFKLYMVVVKRIKLSPNTINLCYTAKGRIHSGIKGFEKYSKLAIFMDDKTHHVKNYTFMNNETANNGESNNNAFPFSDYKMFTGIDLRDIFENCEDLKEVVYDSEIDYFKSTDRFKNSEIETILKNENHDKIPKSDFVNNTVRCGDFIYAMGSLYYLKGVRTYSDEYVGDSKIDEITIATVDYSTLDKFPNVNSLAIRLNIEYKKLELTIKMSKYKGDFHFIASNNQQKLDIGHYAYIPNKAISRIKSVEIFNYDSDEYKLYMNSPSLKTHDKPRLPKKENDLSYLNLLSYDNYDMNILKDVKFLSHVEFEFLPQRDLYSFAYIINDNNMLNGFNCKLMKEDSLKSGGYSSYYCQYRKSIQRLFSAKELATIKKIIEVKP